MIAHILTRLPERWRWRVAFPCARVRFQGVKNAFVIVAVFKRLSSWVEHAHFGDKLRGEFVDEHGLRKYQSLIYR